MSPQRATRTSFKPKDGEALDCRLNIRFHTSMVEQMEQRKRPDESLADWIRAVLRRELLHPTGD